MASVKAAIPASSGQRPDRVRVHVRTRRCVARGRDEEDGIRSDMGEKEREKDENEKNEKREGQKRQE